MTDGMTKKKLQKKNELYVKNIDDWTLYDLVWRSGKPLIDESLYRHERESLKNHTNRIRDGYVFNFGKSIIDIYSFYLNEKKVIRTLEGLENNEQWKMFQKDCDLTGTNYNVFIDEIQKFSSIYGSFGILVNKPGNKNIETIADEIEKSIYPYYAAYSLPNIFDWEWEKDPITHRKFLSFLKLKESGQNYLLWYPDHWEQWTLETPTKQPKKVNDGNNPLGEIPFVWMLNIKDFTYMELGSSDLVDIARIVTSIAQNLSCGEEMIKLAGFPIRRQPMETEDSGDDETQTGPRAVEEFNPEFGDKGKADWMPTEILEPVEAALKWIDRKTDEIYRIAHLSGVHGQRKSNNEVASGLALRYEFSQLNQVLNAKSTNQTEAELQALRLWLKWQDKEELFNNIDIKRSSEFSIDELSVALDNAIVGYKNVVSKTFRVLTQQKIAEHVLPDMSQEDKTKIKTEIEKNTPVKAKIIDTSTKVSTRTALQSKADHSKDGEK